MILTLRGWELRRVQVSATESGLRSTRTSVSIEEYTSESNRAGEETRNMSTSDIRRVTVDLLKNLRDRWHQRLHVKVTAEFRSPSGRNENTWHSTVSARKGSVMICLFVWAARVQFLKNNQIHEIEPTVTK